VNRHHDWQLPLLENENEAAAVRYISPAQDLGFIGTWYTPTHRRLGRNSLRFTGWRIPLPAFLFAEVPRKLAELPRISHRQPPHHLVEDFRVVR
jgi:hypothetical protein